MRKLSIDSSSEYKPTLANPCSEYR